MNKKTVRKRLTEIVGAHKRVQVTRPYPGDPLLNGFVVGMSKKLLLLHDFFDFTPIGYTAIRLADICSCRSGKYERKCEQMLEVEGILDRVGINYEVDLSSTHSLLESLQRRGQNIIVECEYEDDSDRDAFFIGQITELEKRFVRFRHFDETGNWEDGEYRIPFYAITQIEFDTVYVNTFSKYLNSAAPT
jgi:hypothetical protein